uniref:Origin recognition complex subunit 5 C-terminal domain-containing protein n=1 Tax=Panagrolaimus sp. JU765 TaxID=591449 RepID=A0AC34QHD0_9BILA
MIVNKQEIFQTIWDFAQLELPYLRHFHITCNASQYDDFISDFENGCEEGFVVCTTSCVSLGGRPKDLYNLLIEAADSTLKKNVRHPEEFAEMFLSLFSLHKVSRIFICLTDAECLRDVESYPILEELFSGFGSPYFITKVVLVTLSSVPWSLLLNTKISPMCMNYSISKKRKPATEVMKHAEKIYGENSPFSKPFAKCCVKILEEQTTDYSKLFFMCCLLADDCRDEINVYSDKIDMDLLRKYASNYDENVIHLQEIVSLNPADIIERIPYYAKFVLMASYCASYNKRNTDFRFFAKEREANKRSKKAAENKFHETGPQTFSLERLQGISCFFLQSFADDPESFPPFDVIINLLIDMQLLARISHPSNINLPKFRCEASLEFVNEVAKKVGIKNGMLDFLDEDPFDLGSKLANLKITG